MRCHLIMQRCHFDSKNNLTTQKLFSYKIVNSLPSEYFLVLFLFLPSFRYFSSAWDSNQQPSNDVQSLRRLAKVHVQISVLIASERYERVPTAALSVSGRALLDNAINIQGCRSFVCHLRKMLIH